MDERVYSLGEANPGFYRPASLATSPRSRASIAVRMSRRGATASPGVPGDL